MLDKVLKAWECCNPLNRRCFECPYEDDCFHDNFDRVAIADMVKLLKSQQAEIARLKAEKENSIKEIEERKAFNLKCDGQPEWLRKGTDVGLNTALDILKGKDGERE